jgi:hypothetical protein
MKRLTILMTSVLLSAVVFGQTSLPTSWSFDDPQPAGWTEELSNNPGNTRYTNGSVGAACKLDGDDEYVLVHFSDVCGGVTYDLIGQSSASNDIFTVEESADGVNWTDLRVFQQADLDAASEFTEFTDSPLATSRYVRWYFTEKQSGRNVGLDEVTLIAQVPTTSQEIAISSSGQSVVNNSTFVIGNTAQTTFTIENANLTGGNQLNISFAQITGANAAEFTLSSLSPPFAISAESTLDFEVNFSNVAMGSRFATLTITNDDANGDETTFIIELYGIGGDYATEPTAAPTNLQFSDVTTYGYDVSFDDASVTPENYIVIRGIENQSLAQPADGETYVKGDYIDASTQVVHVGPADSFRPSYNVASTNYYFSAFSYNGPAGFENYYVGAPLDGSVTTPETMMGTYYADIDANQTSFLTDIQTRIGQNYNQIFYSNYASIVINKFASRDTTGGQKVITGVYSGFQYLYTGAFFYDVLSREHSWPHSWMPTFLQGSDGDEYSDIHNLFPTHQNSANAVRGNKPLGVVTSAASSFLDAQFGDNADGQRVYEPRDQHKGDAARAIFYMAVKWNGTDGTWELPNPVDFVTQYGQDQDVLKQWHWQDPPDSWEIARNDFIESEQGNRNPFVDSVNWVCYIDFETLTYIGAQSTPCTVTPNGIEEQLEGSFSVSPNPTNGIVTLNLNLVQSQELSIEVLDIAGRQVSTQARSFNSGISRQNFDLSNLDAGIYHMVLTGEKGRNSLKVVLQ